MNKENNGEGRGSQWLEKSKYYMFHNFEQIFVILILVTVVLISYFIPHKTAFLNFYFLPIIISGYLLGRYRTVMGALLCILLVAIYFVLQPESFILPTSKLEVFLHLVIWGGFLILGGAVVGKQQEILAEKSRRTFHLNEELQASENELKKANADLLDYSDNLEQKVLKRTHELEPTFRR